MRGSSVLAAWLLVGCSEYKLSDHDDPTVPLEDDTGTLPDTTEPTEPSETTETTDETTPPDPTCADTPTPEIEWVASPTFADAPDPVDGGGVVFWEASANVSDWDPVLLPDRDIPVGEDRAYVGLFDLPEIPVNLSLNLQSDDGIIVWVNGQYVGQWGGDWQLEGCVNENAQCLVTIQVDPVDVTHLLHVGTNTVATRVSNPVENAYFEIIPECEEPE